MKKVLTFVNTWGFSILIILTLFANFRSCRTNTKIDKLHKDMIITNQKMDSLLIKLSKEIKIEGLKTEKRMIQSTDRKMMDVNRQSEIDKELTVLQND
jgi:hypothetical protein